ncbi:ankyrin repeat-containing domain protein, partial [Coprinopsis sp. MPI-PUGE-AT-0042]
VNLVNSEGRSALMLAARQGYEGVVKLLLKRTEIRVDLVDHKGLSALALAASWGHESIVRLLLHVLNIDTTTNRQDGQTAMSLALDHGHLGVYQLLQEFQPRCEVELEITALGPANLVDLDALEDDYEDQEKREDSPSDEEVQDQSESSDSDCYQDAQEWLEGVDV